MCDTKAITFSRIPILGKTKIEFEDWKFSFERWCKSNNVNDDEKLECLISLTEGIARTIVINSLNNDNPDDYNTIINKLKDHYKSSQPKNSRLLELSTITIKRGEKVLDFNVKFETLLNKINIKLTDEVKISYYINAFRNLPKTYEALLEAEPQTLQEAKEVTSKKEKIHNLIDSNRFKNNFQTNYQKRNFNDNNTFKTNNGKFYNNNNNNNKNNNSNNNYNNNNNYQNNKNNNTSNASNSYYSKFNNANQNIEYRRNTLKYPQTTTDSLQEITNKLADLKLNFCWNCQRIGHVKEDCPDVNSNEPLN